MKKRYRAMSWVTITEDVELCNFEFWGGAKEFAAKLTKDEMEIIADIINDCFQLTKTQLNDLFWFDQDAIAEWLDTTVDDIWARE